MTSCNNLGGLGMILILGVEASIVCSLADLVCNLGDGQLDIRMLPGQVVG